MFENHSQCLEDFQFHIIRHLSSKKFCWKSLPCVCLKSLQMFIHVALSKIRQTKNLMPSCDAFEWQKAFVLQRDILITACVGGKRKTEKIGKNLKFTGEKQKQMFKVILDEGFAFYREKLQAISQATFNTLFQCHLGRKIKFPFISASPCLQIKTLGRVSRGVSASPFHF